MVSLLKSEWGRGTSGVGRGKLSRAWRFLETGRAVKISVLVLQIELTSPLESGCVRACVRKCDGDYGITFFERPRNEQFSRPDGEACLYLLVSLEHLVRLIFQYLQTSLGKCAAGMNYLLDSLRGRWISLR